MSDIPTRLELATEAAEAIQHALRRGQEDLLALEQTAGRLRQGIGSGRVTTDQAEDLRRAFVILREDQLPEIRDGLDHARQTVTHAAVDGLLTPERARTITHMISVANEEADRVGLDLTDAARELVPVSQAIPSDPDLPRHALDSVEATSKWVDRGRRSTFRILEDLPVIARAVESIPAEAEQSALDPTLDIPASPAVDQRLGVTAERRRPPALAHQSPTVAAPAR